MSQDLYDKAKEVRKHAYAPYSNYKVGAALRSKSGQVYAACNVENASYGLSVCAERNALAKAIADGEREFEELVVVTENGVTPCGACRQVIWELCGDVPIHVGDEKALFKTYQAGDLLPHAFDASSLK